MVSWSQFKQGLKLGKADRFTLKVSEVSLELVDTGIGHVNCHNIHQVQWGDETRRKPTPCEIPRTGLERGTHTNRDKRLEEVVRGRGGAKTTGKARSNR